jgi:hypothetical protein
LGIVIDDDDDVDDDDYVMMHAFCFGIDTTAFLPSFSTIPSSHTTTERQHDRTSS